LKGGCTGRIGNNRTHGHDKVARIEVGRGADGMKLDAAEAPGDPGAVADRQVEDDLLGATGAVEGGEEHAPAESATTGRTAMIRSPESRSGGAQTG
jgi:hypothetical protein